MKEALHSKPLQNDTIKSKGFKKNQGRNDRLPDRNCFVPLSFPVAGHRLGQEKERGGCRGKDEEQQQEVESRIGPVQAEEKVISASDEQDQQNLRNEEAGYAQEQYKYGARTVHG